MKLNNKGVIPIVAILIVNGISFLVFHVAIKADHVINRENYATKTPNFQWGNIEWRERLVIDTTENHDAHSLPPGVTVDTHYQLGAE